MKKRLFRSLTAWAAGISLMLTALPVSAFALEGNSADADEVHEGPHWVISEGKWYETGALPDDTDDTSASIQMQNRTAAVNYDPDIESVDLSESNYFPPIRDQDEGSCVAFAGVSYQFTYEMARHMDWNLKAMYDDEEELNQHIFSPAFIYNLCHEYDAKENYHGGTNIRVVYDLLSTYGAVKEADFPSFYDDDTNGDPPLVADKWCQNTGALLDALQYRVSSYEIGNLRMLPIQRPLMTGRIPPP